MPDGERHFLKDDVTSPALVRHGTEEIDYDPALPLVALDCDRIIANGVLTRSRHGAFRGPAYHCTLAAMHGYRRYLDEL